MSFHQGSFLQAGGGISPCHRQELWFLSPEGSFPFLFFSSSFLFLTYICPGPFFDELLSLICLTLQMLLPFTSIFVLLPICCV